MEKQVAQQGSRFDECRRRVAAGCGGKHTAGIETYGGTLAHWVCCPDCPNYAETNSPMRADNQPKPVSRSLP